MTHIPDDLYLGGGRNAGGPFNLPGVSLNDGVGPLGRVFVYDILPLTLQTANVAVLQAPTVAVPLTLAAGTGATLGTAPDGSGRPVIVFDVPRAVSLTSGANLSGSNYTIAGFDVYGQPLTQTRAGPNGNTVNTLKAFKSVVSVTPGATSVSTVSVGSSDVFGMPFAISDVAYVQSVKWAATLAPDAGTFVAAIATDPNTATLGDVRGTYVPSSASNGVRRLVMSLALKDTQVGPSATLRGAIGVQPA